MTTYTDRELDRILDAFLGEGPGAAPDRAIDAALDRVDHVRQRRRGPLAGWVADARRRAAAPRCRARDRRARRRRAAHRQPAGGGPAPTQGVPTVAPSVRRAEPTPSATPLAALTPAPVTPAMAIAIEARNRADDGDHRIQGPPGDQRRRPDPADPAHRRCGDRAQRPVGPVDGPRRPSTRSPRTRSRRRNGSPRTGGCACAPRWPRSRAPSARSRSSPRPSRPAAGTRPRSRRRPPSSSPRAGHGTSRTARSSSLRKGDLTLAVTKMGTEATETGVAKALGNPAPGALSPAPAAVTFPSYVGFTSGLSEGGGTLWFTESLQAFDSAPTDVVRAWVLQAGSHVVTVFLSGPPDQVAAALPEVESMLGDDGRRPGADRADPRQPALTAGPRRLSPSGTGGRRGPRTATAQPARSEHRPGRVGRRRPEADRQRLGQRGRRQDPGDRGDGVRQAVERHDDPAEDEAHEEQQVREGQRRLRPERARHAAAPARRRRPCPGRAPPRTSGARSAGRPGDEPQHADRDAHEQDELHDLDDEHRRRLRRHDDRRPRRAPAEPLEDAVRPLVAGRDRRARRAPPRSPRGRSTPGAARSTGCARAGPAGRVERAEHEQHAGRDDERDQQALAAAEDEPQLVAASASAIASQLAGRAAARAAGSGVAAVTASPRRRSRRAAPRPTSSR